jgi:hypothetical protein
MKGGCLMSNDQNQTRNAFDYHAEIELIGNISGITDPDTNQRVHAYSKMMQGGAKVANTNIAVNHAGREEADFWRLEVWAQSADRASTHNFLMDHCDIGRKVFVKGVPLLNKDSQGRIWPTIRVTKLIGLGGGGGNGNRNNNGNQNQGGFNSQQGGFNQQQGFNPQQGGFPPQQGGFGPQGGFGQQPNGFNPQGGFNPPQQNGGFGAPQGGFPNQGGPSQFGAPSNPQGGFGAPQGGFGGPGQFGAPQFQR